jgi:hypothetical protein
LLASSDSLLDIDQIIALLGGACLVGFRIVDVWPRQENEKHSDEASNQLLPVVEKLDLASPHRKS